LGETLKIRRERLGVKLGIAAIEKNAGKILLHFFKCLDFIDKIRVEDRGGKN
jgi:hypothetical protein